MKSPVCDLVILKFGLAFNPFSKPFLRSLAALAQAVKDLKAGKEIERWIKTDESVFVGKEAAEEALPTRKY